MDRKQDISKDLLSEVKSLIDNNKILELRELLEEYHIIDIFDIMEYLEEDMKVKLFEVLPIDMSASILEECDVEFFKTILSKIDIEHRKNILELMSLDDMADILSQLEEDEREGVMELLSQEDADDVKELLIYEEESAGGIMTTEYIALNANLPIEDAIKKIKEIAPKTELIDTIFVVNRKKELIGTAQLRDILVAPENEKLEEITNEHFVYVDPETDQEEVALIVSKYDLTAIPVLNKKKAMLGIITIDDIVDVIVEEHTEDLLKMGGVAKEETLDSTLWESIKLRLPWLLVNLLTAFLASATIKVFESTIAQVVALSSIMSIITGMGGNAGTQTISIIIRNIAMGKVSLKDSWHLLGKEILLGVIDGAVIGIVTSGIVSIMYGNYYLGIIAFLAMVANLIISGVAGILIPLILQKLKIDPALSSSIFLTTATDVLGFFIFLSLAKVFLVHLM